MYSYIYDEFLNDKKYTRQLNKIENKLINLGIGGKICRISLFNNITELISDEINKGTDNIILVGNDKTINKFLNILAPYPEITIGLIPIGNTNNNIAKLFNIPMGEEACQTISQRRIKKIKLALVNNYYFLRSIHFYPKKGTLECENQYKINTIHSETMCSIINPIEKQNKKCSLHAIMEKEQKKGILTRFTNKKNTFIKSVFPINKIYLKPTPSLSLVIDSQKVIKTPAMISISDKSIQLITGKQT